MKYVIIMFAIAFMASSCMRESRDTNLQQRGENLLTVYVTPHLGSPVNTTCIHAKIIYLYDDLFTLILDEGLSSEQTFTATAVSIYDVNEQTKVIKNPGFGQVVYVDNSEIDVVGEDQDGLRVILQPGSISTTASELSIEP